MRIACVPGQLDVQKATLPAPGLTWWSRLRALLRTARDRWAPLGYQDERGFHFGPEPAVETAQDSPA